MYCCEGCIALNFRQSKFSLRFLLISRIHARVRARHTRNILWARHSSLANKFAREFSTVHTKINENFDTRHRAYVVSQPRPISAREGKVWWTAYTSSMEIQLAGWRNRILHSWITCCGVSTLPETILEVFYSSCSSGKDVLALFRWLYDCYCYTQTIT